MKINVETTVAAPLARVWSAYTTPPDIVKWNAASDGWHTPRASVDLREGGQFSSRMEAKDGSMGFDFAGTYTKIVDQKLIVYAFGDRSAEVVFEPVAGGIRVQVAFDAEATHSIDQQRQGWQAILDNFKRYVEAKPASASAGSIHETQSGAAMTKTIDPATTVELEAAAYRRLVEHLRGRKDVQNIDMMNLAGFCRNCLANWYMDAAKEKGIALSKDEAREIVYGEPYKDWVARNQTEASPAQLAAYEVNRPKEHS